jgi:hemoglobin
VRVIPDAEWRAHLDLIADFWSSLLLGTRRYAGRPMPKHLAIAELGDAHFARWLALFRETAEEICPPPVAALFVDRAERIAQSFRLGLAFHRGEDTMAIEPMRAGRP